MDDLYVFHPKVAEYDGSWAQRPHKWRYVTSHARKTFNRVSDVSVYVHLMRLVEGPNRSAGDSHAVFRDARRPLIEAPGSGR